MSSSSTVAPGGYDVIVIGAGIVGLGAALAARDRGQRVLVLERGAEASGASIRNFGHLCLTPQEGEARAYGVLARELWLRLARDAGVWLRESGTAVVARHEDELALLAEVGESRSERVLGDRAELELLDRDGIERLAPLGAGVAVGGAFLPYDLHANPRQALGAVTAHLQRLGVEFRFRTAATRVETGRVRTPAGWVSAGLVIVAVNHDIDGLLPEVAAERDVQRCALDMLRVDAGLRAPLAAPLLTGWSLIRYRAFASSPAAARVRERLHGERPELAAIDLNQMYTQLPDGSLIVGDTHWRGETASPFQPEHAFELLLGEAETLFGVPRPRVIERWQGVYASGRDEFVLDSPLPGVCVALATTGIGMTTGLGLAEAAVSAHLGGRAGHPTPSPSTASPAALPPLERIHP
ncbi:TIGR03364 family FAD-dependent oxidoreductase [Leucobacter sp. M11]|uniref:TIGR03364 family FAD-dependent oxidoreductase n=1 Tax=Leucobacter sp. M11 TaxID=2993565 RepID=UPI002D7F9F9F|nr:TIGR03364 family FAD-dependent oxidoreductase [Leucobacter sp. M11]MEB4614703.1 TIGR03364 family FAD-dependent oxidoreductase [Leucobacter sp. M11]